MIHRIVVGCIDRLVDIVDMGWDICPRNVPSRDMEFHQRPTLLREAYTTTTTTNHGYDVERCWSVLALQTKARIFVYSMIIVGTFRCVISDSAVEVYNYAIRCAYF